MTATAVKIAKPGQGTGGNAYARDRSIERFWSHVAKGGPAECWPWTSETRNGYGRFRSPYWRGEQYAHRISCVLAFGPIARHLELDHRCHTEDQACSGGNACEHRSCVNPAHLELVTHAENLRRAVERRTTCKNGHDRATEWANGRCAACNRENQARWRGLHTLSTSADNSHSVPEASQPGLREQAS